MCKAAPNTLRAYRSDLGLAARLLPAPLDAITLAAIEDYRTAGDVGAATMQRRTTSLSRFFGWAVRHDYCADNPTTHLEPVATCARLPRPAERGTARGQLDQAIRDAAPPYRLIFTMLRETGMRVGEVLSLNIGDVQLDAGREGLHLRRDRSKGAWRPKNRHERVQVLHPDATPRTLRGLRAHLTALGTRDAHVPLFSSNRGTRLSYDAVEYQWTQHCIASGLLDAAGQPHYTLHQLRHTRATEMLEQGYRIEQVQRALGHRDLRSTQVYAELDDEQLRRAMSEQG